MANSLDIVESCLAQIYSCRKNLLRRKVQNVTARIEARKQLQQKLNSLSKGEEFRLETNDEDDEQDILVRNLSSAYPIVVKPSSPGEVAKHNRQTSASKFVDEDDDEPEPAKPAKPTKVAKEKIASSELNKEQLAELRKEFDTESYELERRLMNGELDEEMDDELEKMIKKYFNRNLDRVTPSAEVSALRQHISHQIEYLAGLEPPPQKTKNAEASGSVEEEPEKTSKNVTVIDVNDQQAIKARLRKMRKKENEGRPAAKDKAASIENEDSSEDEEVHERRPIIRTASARDADQAATANATMKPVSREKESNEKPRSSSQGKRVKFVDEAHNDSGGEDDVNLTAPAPAARAITPNTQRKQQEKLRIKEQYEKYLKSKQKQQIVTEQAHERENLAADIQSVLDSLRNTAV
eukprot:gene11228-7983_t